MNIESYIITFFPALIRSIKKFILRICEWLFAITMIFIKCHDNFFYLKTFKKNQKVSSMSCGYYKMPFMCVNNYVYMDGDSNGTHQKNKF